MRKKESNSFAENDAGPFHVEAFQALEIAFKWFEKQKESQVTIKHGNRVFYLLYIYIYSSR